MHPHDSCSSQGSHTHQHLHDNKGVNQMCYLQPEAVEDIWKLGGGGEINGLCVNIQQLRQPGGMVPQEMFKI